MYICSSIEFTPLALCSGLPRYSVLYFGNGFRVVQGYQEVWDLMETVEAREKREMW